MVTVLLVVIAIVVLSVVVSLVVILAFAASAMRDHKPPVPPQRSAMARGFGLRSKGADQRRALVSIELTADALVIRPTGGAAEKHIPRASITRAERTRSFFGKPVDEDLLEVDWSADAASFHIDDVDGWLQELGPR